MTLALDHWHFEVSSICVLKCPRCPRQEVAESLLNRQLTLEFFQQQIGAHRMAQIKRITFCGNDGDPIYCREFLEIVQWIKQVNPEINLVIVTNGSHRTSQWWEKLAGILNQHDELHWSLDGWDQISNQQYRVNSDWDSIFLGIQTFFSHNQTTYRVWAAIAFRFNQDSLGRMQQQAQSLGFDLFQLTQSTKFGSQLPEIYGTNDALEPTQSDMISTTGRFQRITHQVTPRSRPGQQLRQVFLQRAQDLDKHTEPVGLCMIGTKGIFVTSRGELYPCAWTALRYEHNQSWHELSQHRFNLWNHTLDEILQDTFWSTDFVRFDSHECQIKCSRDRLRDENYVMES